MRPRTVFLMNVFGNYYCINWITQIIRVYRNNKMSRIGELKDPI